MTVITSIPPSGGPIECRLSAGDMAGIEQRMAAYRALGRDHLLSAERDDRRAVLRFGAGGRPGVDDLVANESRCCAFLGYEVREDGEAIVLTLTAPEGGEPVWTSSWPPSVRDQRRHE